MILLFFLWSSVITSIVFIAQLRITSTVATGLDFASRKLSWPVIRTDVFTDVQYPILSATKSRYSSRTTPRISPSCFKSGKYLSNKLSTRAPKTILASNMSMLNIATSNRVAQGGAA